MNNQLFEYYTQLKKLPIKEYGRNITRLIDKIKGIPDKAKRTLYAKQLIKIMGIINPSTQKDVHNHRNRLLHHLLILSNGELDIDYPSDFDPMESMSKQAKLQPDSTSIYDYQSGKPKLRQYGSHIEKLIQKVIELPESPSKQNQVYAIANLMKLCAQKNAEEKVLDETIFEHLAFLSQGKIQLQKEVAAPLQSIKVHHKNQLNKQHFSKNSKNNKNKNKNFFRKKHN